MGEVPLVLEELQECIPNGNHVEEVVDRLYFEEVLNDFHMSESKVKMLLLRLRNEFRVFLEKEIFI